MPTTENKVRYGLKNVHLATCTITTDGSASFGSPVPFPGAVSLTADPDGSVEKFWADNMSYYSYNSESGYSGDLEMAYIPKSILKSFMGLQEDANGLLYDDTDAEQPHFALLFQFEGDLKAVRHVLYNVTAAPVSLSGNTTEGANEPQTETVSISASPIYVPGVQKNTSHGRCEEGDSGYSSFFTAVQVPSATTN